MIDAAGKPKTLEFNCRLGDPETQPIMMRLKTDLFEVLMHAADGTLDKVELEWDRRVALGVVHGGGTAIRQRRARATSSPACPAEPPTTAMVFHAGTAREWRRLVDAAAAACCASPRSATR